MDAALAVLVMLVLVLVAFVALARRMFGYFSDYVTWRFPRVKVTDIDFAPGDILLFNASTHGYTNSAVTRDFYSHGGMVVADPDTGRLFVSDSSGGEVFQDEDEAEYTTRAESAILPLFARLKHYAGEVYHMRLVPGLTDRQTRKLWNLVQERVPYPGPGAAIAGLFHLPRPGVTRHCMEHVAWFLDSLGLTPTELSIAGKTLEKTGLIGVCKRVTRLADEPLGPKGHSRYSQPVHLLYDIDAMSRAEWERFTQKRGAPSPERFGSVRPTQDFDSWAKSAPGG